MGERVYAEIFHCRPDQFSPGLHRGFGRGHNGRYFLDINSGQPQCICNQPHRFIADASYRLGFYTNQTPNEKDAIQKAEAAANNTWHHPTLLEVISGNESLSQVYDAAYTQWQQTLATLKAQPNSPASKQALARQLELLDALVTTMQRNAEANAHLLRLIQVFAIGLILLLAGFVFYWLRTKVKQPLEALARTARNIEQGHYDNDIAIGGQDELGLLATAFQRMNRAIAHSHDVMAQQIQQQTEALQRSNTALQFLYDTAKNILESDRGAFNFDGIVSRLAQLVDADDMELCLVKEGGDAPYLQIKPQQSPFDPCDESDCSDCLIGDCVQPDTKVLALPSQSLRYSFPMASDNQRFGVLVCRLRQGQQLQQWQRQLIESVADQFGLALKLQTQKDNAKRLSLVEERTVIARELHDSLAQALSYLKIQVARLDHSIERGNESALRDVSGELREGLDAAYRQLRELLTTFRLKVEQPGLQNALEASIRQLATQTNMAINLDYTLKNIPLTPNEEIHLLQIVREASQNAINHSYGHELIIRVVEDRRQQILLSIEDDGVGIGEAAEKLHHYGLAIMLERGKNLNGKLEVRQRPAGGTGVYLSFLPAYLKQRDVIARTAP